MKGKLLALVACFTSACAVAPGAAPAGSAVAATPSAVQAAAAPERASMALANPGFEEPFGERCALRWYCAMHNDPESFRFFLDAAPAAEGKHAVCIEPTKREPWAELTQVLRDRGFAGRHVRFSMSVRRENVAGAGAGVIVLVHDGHGNTPTRKARIEAGSSGWSALTVELNVPEEAYDIEVGGILEGTGRACFDDAKLEVSPR